MAFSFFKVEILASLQKPKKICLNGSDGKSYTMMCKPKDDLRKDCRLMEFNCLINKVHWAGRDHVHGIAQLFSGCYMIIVMNISSNDLKLKISL